MNYKIPNPETFFLKTPLYEKFGPLGPNYRDFLKIEFNQDTIDTFCIECNQNSIFTCGAQLPDVGMGVQPLSPKSVDDLVQNYQTAWLPTVEGDSVAQTKLEEYTLRDRLIQIKFTCTRVNQHEIHFILRVYNKLLEKIGQSPSIADLEQGMIDKYRKILGKEKSAEIIRAIGLSAHGIGIGSFVYLRRIFEDLIETSHQQASQASDWNEAEYIKGRMDEKILLLKDCLPEFLVENRSVYSILSAGIHSLSEQECLEYYEPLKLAIEIVLDQKLERQEREQKENLTRKAISQIKSKLGG